MQGVPTEIIEMVQLRQLNHVPKVHPDYTAGVAQALGHSFNPKAA